MYYLLVNQNRSKKKEEEICQKLKIQHLTGWSQSHHLPPKPEVLTKGKRKRMVQTGTDLRSLTTEDIAFILDMNNSDAAVRSRYHTAIQR